MKADDSRVPDITLERYRLNELPDSMKAHIDALLETDAALRQRLDALRQSDDQIHAAGRLASAAAGVQRTLAADAPDSQGRLWASVPPWVVPAAVATAVVLLLVIPRMTTLSVDDGERIKGLQPSLALFRRVGNGSETLADGAVAHPGDLIRVGYRAAGRAYGVILSIDGRKNVTVHLPRHGEAAAALERDPTVLLDHSYELDDAPRWERFYFITSDQPFAVAPIVTSAHQAAGRETPVALPLSAAFEQSIFSLLKEGKP
jgi:hypothetical protein